jgi:hypothetical protein
VSDTTSVTSGLISILIMCGFGLYAIQRGRMMLRTPTSAKPRFWLLIIGLVRIVQGETAAMHKEAELMTPDRIRRHGYYRLIVGSGLLVGGALQLAGWIVKIVGL